MRCPICGKQAVNVYRDTIENILCEELYLCKDEHHSYSYEYAYGMTEESIGDKEFKFHYTQPKEDREKEWDKYEMALNDAKEEYHKAINSRK